MSGAWIQTASGRRLFPFNPDMDQVVATDIAHHLANQCRFAGACDPFYSIAEHCVRGAEEVRRRIEASGGSGLDRSDLGVVLAFLLHDSEEYAFMDLPAPLKELPEFSFYVVEGDRFRGKIYSKFGARPGDIVHPLVAEVDLVMLATEKRDLMVESTYPWRPLPDPLVDPIHPWPPAVARAEFLFYWQCLAVEGGFPLPVDPGDLGPTVPVFRAKISDIAKQAFDNLTDKEQEILRKRFPRM